METTSTENPDDGFGTTLEQFRRALPRAVARRNMNLHLSDERAAQIAADEHLSAVWYAAWRGRVGPPTPMTEPADPPADLVPPRLIDEWERSLPLRFHPPPGWTVPGHDWIVRHIGLEMCDAWRPDGAPRSDPEDWLWWVPQEPAWTAWVEQETRRFRMLPWLVGVFVTSVVILVAALPTEGSALLLIPVAMGSGLGAIVLVVQHRHFMKDPVGRFRDEYMEYWPYRGSVNPSGALGSGVAADVDGGGFDFDFGFD